MTESFVTRVALRRPNDDRRKPRRKRGDPRRARMTIRTENRRILFEVPYAPRAVAHSGFGWQWAEVARPGRRPILSPSAKPLHKMGFDLFLGHPDASRGVEPHMARLRHLAATTKPIVVAYGPSEGGLWRLTALSFNSIERRFDDTITRATATVEFTRASNYKPGRGPSDGGHDDNNGGGGGGGGGNGDENEGGPRRYVVKRGDTLHSISIKFYGTPKRWRKIADRNKMRRAKPGKHLNVGKRLVIPRIPRNEPNKPNRPRDGGGRAD